MRKIVLQLAVSLDGFIEDAKGSYDWCFTDGDYGMKDFLNRVDTLIMGRKTYEVMLSMGNQGMPGFPKLKEYVFSNTLTKLEGERTLVNTNVEETIKQLKNESGKDIWLFGGATLVSFLIRHSFIDELILAVHPILLGSGKPLFQPYDKRIKLKLLNNKEYPNGLVMLTYEVKND
ncbi:MAG TPA: dihydrofolate reductase family protein [Chitinophagaceae bacterium]|nr:dihydrofolate reductase family protein [Chitinophagaceae bacterium]